MAREEILRFKRIDEDCETWDEVIADLKSKIEFMTKLKELTLLANPDSHFPKPESISITRKIAPIDSDLRK